MQLRNFSINCIGETLIKGYDTGESWNGWACPLFSFEQAQALVLAWQAKNWTAYYDSTADAFVFSVNQDLETDDSDELETFTAVELDGAKFYPIGSGSWIWDVEELPANTC